MAWRGRVPRVICLSEFGLQSMAELRHRQVESRILIRNCVIVKLSFLSHGAGGVDGAEDRVPSRKGRRYLDPMLPRPAVFHRAVRCFSSTRPTHGYTSHIGKTPIPVPTSVTLNTTPTRLEVTGPLGSTSVPLEQYMHLTPAANGVVALSVDDATQKKQRSMWGLTRTLINNAVIGMTEGFSVPLYLVGVGYRAALEDDPRGTENGGNGKRLNMKLGFSHSVFVPIPPHIKAEVPTATKIVLSCTDNHQLGLFAAKVRKWRPPEPYKGKVCFLRLRRVV